MHSDNLKIVVAGDVNIDWYFWKRASDSNTDETIHWKLYDGLNMCPQIGGALLLSDMLKESTVRNDRIKIIDQKPKNSDQPKSTDLDLLNDPSKTLHTNIKLDLFPDWKSDSKKQVYRVKTFLGFTTPKNYFKPATSAKNKDYPDTLEIAEDDEKADFVVILDVGNGFRDTREKWPKAIIEEKRKPIIIHYMNLPLFKGDLWEHVKQYHSQKLILILNAEDLRKLGANISRSLSWEKTALEFLWEMNTNTALAEIKNLPNVIVRFGLEGAIHYNGKDRNISSKLYFDPSSVEGGFWDSKKFGVMKGISAVFVSSLTSKLISNFDDGEISDKGIKEGIEFGLLKSREFMRKGHGNEFMRKGYGNKEKNNEKLDPEFFSQISKNLFKLEKEDDQEGNDHIECVELPHAECYTEPDPIFWSILKEKTKGINQDLVEFAVKIVIEGSSVLKCYPAGYFGKLTTVDRAEIESYRSIMNIMEGYINSEKHQGLYPLRFLDILVREIFWDYRNRKNN